MIYDLPKLGEVPPIPKAIGVETRPGRTTYTERNRPVTISGSTCGSLRVFAKTPDGAEKPNLYVGKGTVGEDNYETDTDLGGLDEASDNSVYIKIELDGTDGTYTDEFIVDSDKQSDDTTTYFLLGAVAADGTITQYACGPVFVTVCRNWYAAESPYYGMTVST